eukprot:ctg_314.g117
MHTCRQAALSLWGSESLSSGPENSTERSSRCAMKRRPDWPSSSTGVARSASAPDAPDSATAGNFPSPQQLEKRTATRVGTTTPGYPRTCKASFPTPS